MFGKKVFFMCFVVGLFVGHEVSGSNAEVDSGIDFSGIKSPIVLRGDSKVAFRDPAALYHDEIFYLFYTL